MHYVDVGKMSSKEARAYIEEVSARMGHPIKTSRWAGFITFLAFWLALQ